MGGLEEGFAPDAPASFGIRKHLGVNRTTAGNFFCLKYWKRIPNATPRRGFAPECCATAWGFAPNASFNFQNATRSWGKAPLPTRRTVNRPAVVAMETFLKSRRQRSRPAGALAPTF